MMGGMLSLRAGVHNGRPLASRPRRVSNLRLTVFGCRMVLYLVVLTAHVLITARRIILRERGGIAVFSALSKGSICVAIWRAADGLNPRCTKPGNATPGRCDVSAAEARTDSMRLSIDG